MSRVPWNFGAPASIRLRSPLIIAAGGADFGADMPGSGGA
jgi:hypothetical protein